MGAREHFVVRVLWEHYYWSTGGQNIASSTEKAHRMRVLRRPNYRAYWLGVWVLRDPESTVNFIPAIIPKHEINTGVPALSVVRSLEILRVLELHTPRSKYFGSTASVLQILELSPAKAICSNSTTSGDRLWCFVPNGGPANCRYGAHTVVFVRHTQKSISVFCEHSRYIYGYYLYLWTKYMRILLQSSTRSTKPRDIWITTNRE